MTGNTNKKTISFEEIIQQTENIIKTLEPCFKLIQNEVQQNQQPTSQEAKQQTNLGFMLHNLALIIKGYRNLISQIDEIMRIKTSLKTNEKRRFLMHLNQFISPMLEAKENFLVLFKANPSFLHNKDLNAIFQDLSILDSTQFYSEINLYLTKITKKPKPNTDINPLMPDNIEQFEVGNYNANPLVSENQNTFFNYQELQQGIQTAIQDFTQPIKEKLGCLNNKIDNIKIKLGMETDNSIQNDSSYIPNSAL